MADVAGDGVSGASVSVVANLTIIAAGFLYASGWVIGLTVSVSAWWVAIKYVSSVLIFPVLTPSIAWMLDYFQVPYGIGIVLGAMSFIVAVRRLVR